MSQAPNASPEQHVYQLMPDRFLHAEYAVQDLAVKVEAGVTKEQVLNPAFWAHISERMNPYDEVRIRYDDGTVYGRVLVLECGRNWARVYCLEWHNLSTSDVAQSKAAELEVKHRGPRGWSVVRKADNAVIAESIETRDAAEAEMKRLATATAAGA